jgi:acyl dehydratase
MVRHGGYDDLEVGYTFGRQVTVTEMHALLANTLFFDSVPLHTDEEAGASSMYGRRIAPGPLVAGIASVTLGMHLDGAAVGYLEQTERFKAPIYPGDTVSVEWTVASKTAKPRFKGGIVTFDGICRNDRGQVVIELNGTAIVSNAPDELGDD